MKATFYYSIVLAILVVIVTGCGTNKIEENTGQTNLTYSGESFFELDTASDAFTRSVQVYPKANPEYLVFHHQSSNTIDVFDINTNHLFKKIVFSKEGPNGVGEGISSMYMHSFDSIFLFNGLAQRLLLMDSAANLTSTFDLRNNSAYTDMGTLSPAFIKGEWIHLSAYPSPMKRPSSHDFAAIKFNLSTNNLEGTFFLSEEYDRGWWGPHNFLKTYQTYVDESDKKIYSFPNDENVYSIDEFEKVESHPAKASDIHLEPFADKPSNDDESIFRFEGAQGFYSGLSYDRWQNVYYRFAFNPVSDYHSPFDLSKNISVVILDSLFRKVGETHLEKGIYTLGAFFITPKGLHLLNRKKYDDNDNFLSYDVYHLSNESALEKKDLTPNFNNFFSEVVSANTYPDIGVIVIPASGCQGCIDAAANFMRKNIDNPDYLFIVTEIVDKKYLKNWLGYDIFSNPKLKFDYNNAWRKWNLNSSYPQIVTIKDQTVSTMRYIDPTSKFIWDELSKR